MSRRKKETVDEVVETIEVDTTENNEEVINKTVKVEKPSEETTTVDVEKRKEEIKEGLIGTADEKLDGELQKEREKSNREVKEEIRPSTEPNFREGMSIAGPFGRTRVAPAKTASKPATPDNPRRGVQRIWPDRRINNVGEGHHK